MSDSPLSPAPSSPPPAAPVEAPTTVLVPASSQASSSSLSSPPDEGLAAVGKDEGELEPDASLGVSEVGRLMDEHEEREKREKGKRGREEEGAQHQGRASPKEPAHEPSSTVLVPPSQDDDVSSAGEAPVASGPRPVTDRLSSPSTQLKEAQEFEQLAAHPSTTDSQLVNIAATEAPTPELEPIASAPSPTRRSSSPRPSPPNAVASSSKLPSPPARPPPPPAPVRDQYDDLLDGIDLDDDLFDEMDIDTRPPSTIAPPHLPALDTSMDTVDDDEVLPSSQPDERPAELLKPLNSSQDTGQPRPMSSPPSDYMSRGFTTGGDKKAPMKPIGEEALMRERRKMEKDAEEEDKERDGGAETLSAKRRRLNTPTTMSRSGSPFERPGPSMPKRLPPPTFGLSAPPPRVAQVAQGDDQDPFSNRISRPPSRAASPAQAQHAFEAFKTASGKLLAPPSRAQLEKAAKVMEVPLDESEMEEIISASQPTAPAPPPYIVPRPAVVNGRRDSPAMMGGGARTPLSVVHGENGEQANTPSRPSLKNDKTVTAVGQTITDTIPPPSANGVLPLRPSMANNHNASSSSTTPLRPTAFRAPSSTIVRPTPTSFRPPATPTNAHASTSTSTTSTPLRTPLMQPPRYATPAAPTPVALRRVGVGLGMTPRSKGAKKRPAFTTPFKKGHEGGVGTLFADAGKGKEREIAPPSAQRGKVPKVKKEYQKVFDLTPPEKRVSMANAFVRPEFYSPDELADMDIPEEIWRINPSNAAYYGFLDTTSTDPNSPHKGFTDALKELNEAGCEGLTPAWVENHWALILWKLASLVRSKPSLFGEEKFSWEEMMRQLKYRYEREHNLGHRSAVQRIQEQDSPASLSSVMVVSAIAFHPAPTPEVGARDAPPAGTMLASLELTDGWYRIQATTDVVLSRAAQRGKLKVGCKIGLSGVRLEAKEGGTPVLRALTSSSLTLTANTTSLLPWDTKLGFHPRPFIACLASLSADGGLVPVMDIVVDKCFPLAYVDGYDAPPPNFGGKQASQAVAPVQRGPQISRSEADEAKEVVKWEKATHSTRRTVRAEMEKDLDALATLTDRVERAAFASPASKTATDDSDDSYEDTYYSLDSAPDKTAFLKTLAPSLLPGLAKYMKQRHATEMEGLPQAVEDEVASRCPPRNVRSMRVLKVRDWKTTKGEGGKGVRTAQLTLWDAAAMDGEDGEGVEVGGRYLVTNLMPSQRGSWAMAGGGEGGRGGEIYLSTRRDSRWERMN